MPTTQRVRKSASGRYQDMPPMSSPLQPKTVEDSNDPRSNKYNLFVDEDEGEDEDEEDEEEYAHASSPMRSRKSTARLTVSSSELGRVGEKVAPEIAPVVRQRPPGLGTSILNRPRRDAGLGNSILSKPRPSTSSISRANLKRKADSPPPASSTKPIDSTLHISKKTKDNIAAIHKEVLDNTKHAYLSNSFINDTFPLTSTNDTIITERQAPRQDAENQALQPKKRLLARAYRTPLAQSRVATSEDASSSCIAGPLVEPASQGNSENSTVEQAIRDIRADVNARVLHGQNVSVARTTGAQNQRGSPHSLPVYQTEENTGVSRAAGNIATTQRAGDSERGRPEKHVSFDLPISRMAQSLQDRLGVYLSLHCTCQLVPGFKILYAGLQLLKLVPSASKMVVLLRDLKQWLVTLYHQRTEAVKKVMEMREGLKKVGLEMSDDEPVINLGIVREKLYATKQDMAYVERRMEECRVYMLGERERRR